MTAPTADDCRALVVVCRSHGELGLATCFLRGQQFARGAQLLLPAGFPSDDPVDLPARAARYSAVGDVLRAAEDQRATLAFLFSGYLMQYERLLPLEELVSGLQARGCRVVTSDPLVGLTTRVERSEVDLRMVLPWRLGLVRWLHSAVIRVLPGPEHVLAVPGIEGLPHLYPTLPPDLGPADDVPRLSFFDPQVVRAPGELPGRPTTEGAGGEVPRWLFVLSPSDLECQCLLMGFGTFAKLVARTIQRAEHLGRYPVLIGPPKIVKVLSTLEGQHELVPYCPYTELEERSLAAEYAFYWSSFSFPMLARIANERPVFTFDRGRLARTVRPMYSAGVTSHYGGWAPPLLDQRRPLDPGVLAELAEAQRRPVQVLSARWKASPAPDEVVRRLMREPAAT